MICYWLGVYGLSTLWTYIAGEDPAEYALRRVFTTGAALVLASLITFALTLLKSGSVATKVLYTLAFSFIAALSYKLISDWIFYGWTTLPKADADEAGFLQSLFYWSAAFFGWGMCVVSMLYADALRFAAVHAERLRADALDAQLQAMHQQVNPHFLFNTLNSLAALVERRDTGQALAMIDDLAEFLRTTLDTEPGLRVPMAVEVHMQRRYLEIEKRRFGDRLSYTIAITPVAMDCLVPALLIQPLVENAVKHGMAGHDGSNQVEIEAYCAGACLEIVIRNPFAPESREARAGLGLTNVRQRLSLLYGTGAALRAEPAEPGFWVSRLSLPRQQVPE